ncbi:MAG: hypothetical protein WB791_10620 [Waddliaceae bacterium]
MVKKPAWEDRHSRIVANLTRAFLVKPSIEGVVDELTRLILRQGSYNSEGVPPRFAAHSALQANPLQKSIDKIDDLVKKIRLGQGLLSSDWDNLSIDEQHALGSRISKNLNDRNYCRAATTIYRDLYGSAPAAQIERQLEKMHDRYAYFHGTKSEENVLSILRSGKIDVRHEGRFPGAFVSTQPEKDYGPYYFAFKRQIEWGNTIKTGWGNRGEEIYWAGFSEPISTDPDSLECIFVGSVNGESEIETQARCERLKLKIKEQLNRDIEVLPLKPMLDAFDREGCLVTVNRCIPRHWPQTRGQNAMVYHNPHKLNRDFLTQSNY